MSEPRSAFDEAMRTLEKCLDIIDKEGEPPEPKFSFELDARADFNNWPDGLYCSLIQTVDDVVQHNVPEYEYDEQGHCVVVTLYIGCDDKDLVVVKLRQALDNADFPAAYELREEITQGEYQVRWRIPRKQ